MYTYEEMLTMLLDDQVVVMNGEQREIIGEMLEDMGEDLDDFREERLSSGHNVYEVWKA